jgi:hypothetical protein
MRAAVELQGENSVTELKNHRVSRGIQFDCVMTGAGLRASEYLLRLEKLVNLIHARAPHAKICFNTTPADTAEAVQRWI